MDSINQMGISHLANNPDLYEIQRTNNAIFVVTGVDNITNIGKDDGSTIPNVADVLKYSVISFPTPTFSQSPIEIRRGNSVMRAAGTPSFNQGNITVRDYIGADSMSALMSWQALSYNPRTDTVGRMKDYKKTCYVIEYDVDQTTVVRTWTLYGCWVTGISDDGFDISQGNEKTITANISYDRAIMDLPD